MDSFEFKEEIKKLIEKHAKQTGAGTIDIYSTIIRHIPSGEIAHIELTINTKT